MERKNKERKREAKREEGEGGGGGNEGGRGGGRPGRERERLCVRESARKGMCKVHMRAHLLAVSWRAQVCAGERVCLSLLVPFGHRWGQGQAGLPVALVAAGTQAYRPPRAAAAGRWAARPRVPSFAGSSPRLLVMLYGTPIGRPGESITFPIHTGACLVAAGSGH